jgi:hypothetical protein
MSWHWDTTTPLFLFAPDLPAQRTIPMSRSRNSQRYGNQRHMRAQAKVQIRRSDRHRFGPLDEDTTTQDLAPARAKHSAIK